MKLLLPLIAVFLFLPGTAQAAFIEELKSDVRPGHLIVSGPNLKEELSRIELNNAGAVLKEEIVPGEVWLVRLESGVSLAEGKSELKQEEGVRAVEFDTRVEAANLPPLTEPVPNDGSWANLWGLQNTAQLVNGARGISGADIKARYAWQLEKGLAGEVVVGVADTGIDLQHGDLDGKIWTNPDEIAGNNIDDDGNGYKDDTHGWNWISSNNNPDDDQYHGTHVAGTIAAESNNGYAITGVSWGARLAPLKVLDSGGTGWTSDIMAAAEYAGKEGMEVFNASLGGGSFSSAFLSTLQRYPDTLYVFAAGNNGQNIETSKYYPCSYSSSNVLCVGASGQSEELASFSNYGASEVDLVAPGVNILSTYPKNSAGEDRIAYLNGTSMATPHVSGVAALMRQYRPNGTAAAYASIIKDTADDFPAFAGKTVSGGRLNAYSALVETSIRNPGEDPPEVTITSGTPAWVSTRSPSWQFTVLRASGSPQCKIDAINPEGGSDWSGPCSTSSSHQVSNLVEGENYTFEVSASNNLGTDIATHSFRVDTIAPAAPVITSAPPRWVTSSSATWQISGETGATFFCRLVGDWAPCSGAVLGSATSHVASGLSDGDYTFSVRQQDAAGNVSSQSSMTFSVDTTPPPSPTILSRPSEWSSSSSASISFQSEFSASCSFDGAAYQPCSSPFTRNSLSEGEHSLRITQADEAGNVSNFIEVVWNVDTVAPSAPVVQGPSGITAFRNISMLTSAEAGATIRCSLDNITLGDCSSSQSYENLSLGEHTFRAEQVDRAGNVSPTTTRVFTISDSGGELTWNETAAAVGNNSSPRFSWTLSDPSYQVKCALSDSIFRSCSGVNQEQLHQLIDGNYVFSVRVEDGNGSWLVKSYSFRVDTTPPVIALSGPSGLQTSRSVTYSWTVSEGSAQTCRLDNASFAPCSSPSSFAGLVDGDHAFSVRAADAAGNSAEVIRSFSIDATPPAAPSLEVVSGRSNSAEVRISAEGGSLSCRLNSGAWSACSSPWKGVVGDGTQRLEARAVDAVGNVSSVASVSWETGPVALPEPSLRGPLSNGLVYLEGATGAQEYLCSFAGEPMRTCSSPVSLRLTNGVYPYRLQIKEGSRLSAEVSGSVTISGAPAPPGGQVGVSINSGQLYTNNPNVSLGLVWPAGTREVILASDGSFNGQTFSISSQLPWSLPVSGAERLPKTVYVRFLGAGGEALYSGSDDIILDTRPPEINRARAIERIQGAGKNKQKVFRLVVQARDASSGIHLIQTRRDKTRPGPNQNGAQQQTDDTPLLQGRGRAPSWVRVRDRAGNWSDWKRTS